MDTYFGGSMMKCSVCGEDACYLKYHYSNDRRIEFVEALCKEHLNLNRKNIKKERKKIYKMRMMK